MLPSDLIWIPFCYCDNEPGGLCQLFGSIKASDTEGEGKEQLCQEQESDVGGKVGVGHCDGNGDGVPF